MPGRKPSMKEFQHNCYNSTCFVFCSNIPDHIFRKFLFFFIFSDLLLCLNVRLLYVHIHRRSHKDFFLCNSYYIVYISAFYINDEYISIWIMYLAKIELTYSICVLNCLCNIHKTFIHVVCMFCFIVTPSFISISLTVLFSFTHFFSTFSVYIYACFVYMFVYKVNKCRSIGYTKYAILF